MDFKKDENGIILDGDELFARLEALDDADKYEELEKLIGEVPEENRSLKLRFFLVSALNNQKKLAEAIEELKKIEPLCKEKKDVAKFWYMTGYVHYISDHEMTASHCFKTALAIDPEDEGGLDLKEQIEECDGFIAEDLEALRKLSAAASEVIRLACAQTAPENKKALSGEEFAMYLGYLPAMRELPGLSRPLLFDDFKKKFEGNDREAVKTLVKNSFDITDAESFKRFYKENMNFNMYFMIKDVLALLGGQKPSFSPDELSPHQKELFSDTAEFVDVFREFLPTGSVLGWDISEKIGTARLCFACDIISEEDYTDCVMGLASVAKQAFSSFEEYLKSVFFGFGAFMFLEDNAGIKTAVGVMDKALPVLLKSPLPDFLWKS